MSFLRSFENSGFPPIFESSHLSELVGVEERYLHSMVFATGAFYRTFKIKKRSGGHREISTPFPSLRQAQQWIKSEILDRIKIHKTATGFTRKRDIIYNAKIHCGRDDLLKIDIKDFFPNIELERVIAIFMRIGYPHNVSFMLARLCTLDDKLPQGAITSPAISNIIMKPFDAAMYTYSKNRSLRYTRYADDIAVSGNEVSSQDANFFLTAIKNFGFAVNEKKYILLHKGEKKIVTGLDVTGTRVRATREFRRDLARDIFFVWSAGLETHVARRKIFHPYYIEHLSGRMDFLRRVEPENRQLKTMIERMRSIRSR